jgi:restriction system protein
MARTVWQIEIRHDGLGKYRMVRGYDREVVARMAVAQRAAWDEMWERKQEREARDSERQQRKMDRESGVTEAAERTAQARSELEVLEGLLAHTLSINDAVDWESLKDRTPFSRPRPVPTEPSALPREPLATDSDYQPVLGLLDKVVKSRREERVREAEQKFQAFHSAWEKRRDEVLAANKELAAADAAALAKWEDAQRGHVAKQTRANDAVDARRTAFEAVQPDAVTDCFELVLSKSKYPDSFPKEFELDYNPASKVLVVDYSLPSLDDMPTVKEVKYVQSRDEHVEVAIPESARTKLYDSVAYQVALRTLHELYEADTVGAVDSIVFNGWVSSIDKATGNPTNACILTVQAGRNEFQIINLAAVDPRTCFKSLKGIGSSKLHSLTPVAPIITVSREDKRFVTPYDVVNDIDESSNLAAMDWEDFENLIRELFQQEFSRDGGEVKITQASRDGGVDAVAFDPDPIRGGKIVIQAKRYTNTVGVSAVRDLYGTLMNEGATKGILVTTSDYGPDAYDFAKGKPLTLLNGANLLHLLEKHGHKACIDLRAAKKLLSEQCD